MSNLRRGLAIHHLVDGVNPHDAVAEPFTLKMVFEFDLSLPELTGGWIRFHESAR